MKKLHAAAGSRSRPSADLAVMDDMTRETAEGPDELDLINELVARISDDEIEARLQWTLAMHQTGIYLTHE